MYKESNNQAGNFLFIRSRPSKVRRRGAKSHSIAGACTAQDVSHLWQSYACQEVSACLRWPLEVLIILINFIISIVIRNTDNLVLNI